MTDSKARLRQTLLAARVALGDSERGMRDQRIQSHLLRFLEAQAESNCALYQAFRGEPALGPVMPLLHAAGHALHLPVVQGQRLAFHRWQPQAAMTPNHFGIAEPLEGGVLPVDALDFIFIPLVAFDARGNRLGMGGGFYDRALAEWVASEAPGPRRIGIAYALQQVELLPAESWDVPLEAVITEQGLRSFL